MEVGRKCLSLCVLTSLQFGAFLAGLICPHQGGFAIKVTEKIEDLVSALFLPLYFALSGLSTNLGLLNSGITWAYVVGVIGVAFIAKFLGGSIAARLNGLVWRESFTIGALMSCKGLVELIVLNIGLSAKILSTRVFTIFVVMALITTFATTPLTAALYPLWYQRKLEAWKRGEIEWKSGKPLDDSEGDNDATLAKIQSMKIRSLLVYLRLGEMPTLLAFVSLLGGKPRESKKHHPSRERPSSPGETAMTLAEQAKLKPVQIHGVRLVELTERGSTVMKVSEVDEYTLFDPVLNAFKVLGQLYNLAVSGEVSIAPVTAYADILVNKATDEASDLLLLPWSETGSMVDSFTISRDGVKDHLTSDAYTSFASNALEQATCNTAIFLNKGFSGTLKQRPSALSRSMSAISLRRHGELQTLPVADRSHHIFLPFFGGADGRVAIRLVLQLAENPEVTATIVHYDSQAVTRTASADSGNVVEQINVASKETTSDKESDAAFFATLQRSLSTEIAERVLFEIASAATPLERALERMGTDLAQNPKNGGDIVVLGRSSVPGCTSSVHCLGAAAAKVLDAGIRASLLVVQAGKE